MKLVKIITRGLITLTAEKFIGYIGYFPPLKKFNTHQCVNKQIVHCINTAYIPYTPARKIFFKPLQKCFFNSTYTNIEETKTTIGATKTFSCTP